ncbi:Delta 8 Fatty Acid Desaturase [Komagataella phaffii CBS 7435]|uniref:Delta 8-(E)-sphingolipid desaturase n=2 Tax=Komagataella phaffii TaxID=460519 RepID=SLD1_KOMPG|nr:Hypothetical protein PAS_chr1-1_0013 [Komagataella phaffii GS115]C4QVU3.1 RecName: Full=Delta 8-(E)-sphingolipid desaturase [Komagataella phaffii GS115]AAU10084.1 delta 8-(E)-sphingolipid desaturase [Komagataella pastoris]AOA61344.1 GQ67_02570T0 [Komagataella phaffii]CAH2446025.1 Delta 8 Fatty Acid Desaturase [Komagataella phaffii CBS 7435]AOA65537.1 GQ68_02678T0 [Komagataella phaffii GS115]CAY67366.1 Hypothetical protein PAS_chr1-1_0013 [Komagataella phaffii GS115]
MVVSREEVREIIGRGNAIVIYEDHLLNLNGWLERHPGGEKAIHHMIGRDASDEMNAYHDPETVKTFKRWSIGRVKLPWDNLVPPIQGGNYSFDKVDQRVIYKKLGIFPGVKIEPKVQENIVLTEKSASKLLPVGGVRDPKTIIEDFDNKLVYEDIKQIPSLDHETQRNLSLQYNELHQTIINRGYYQCDYWQYFKEFCRISSLFLLFVLFLRSKWYTLSAISIGLMWQQLVFIAHDAGHISITHNYQIDNIIGIIIANFIGGLSLGWWKRNHNVHHLVTNDPVHDPDIQHLPFFAVSSRLLGNVFSTYYEKYLWFDKIAQKMLQIQHKLYYPILSFGRFNLYRLSWSHLIMGLGPRKGKAAWFRYLELIGLCFFSYWFFYKTMSYIPTKTLRFWFLLISHWTTMIVHVQIVLSHFAMSTSDLGSTESFVSRQLRTTMDVDCPEWFDFFHGGLQFQAIHHLFPRLPRHNFRKVQPLVIEFCKNTGLHYSIYGFVDGNGKVVNKMADVASQVVILNDCLHSIHLENTTGKNLYEAKVESVSIKG